MTFIGVCVCVLSARSCLVSVHVLSRGHHSERMYSRPAHQCVSACASSCASFCGNLPSPFLMM